MEQKYLGTSNIKVPALCIGANVFGWTTTEKESFLILDSFFEAGYNFIDTADVYSRWKPGNKGGESETIIGKWMKDRNIRDKVVLATKVGGDMGAGKSLSKTYILKALEDSLSRLQTDYVDLYQSHFDDLSIPVDETLEAFAILHNQSKIKIAGASNFTVERLAESVQYSKANQTPSYQTFQPEYNLYERKNFETVFAKYCKENDITPICYYALASGFLTGKYRSEEDLSKSLRGSGIKKYLDERGFRILKVLDQLSEKYRCSLASISLAWLQHQNVIPIVSASSAQQVSELIYSSKIELEADDLSLLNKASDY